MTVFFEHHDFEWKLKNQMPKIDCCPTLSNWESLTESWMESVSLVRGQQTFQCEYRKIYWETKKSVQIQYWDIFIDKCSFCTEKKKIFKGKFHSILNENN